MQKEKKEKHFLKKPVYPGGDKALRQFVSDHLRYPQDALQRGIQGSVHLQYAIDHQGNTRHIKVISGIGAGCDEEAVRLVKALKYQVSRTPHLRIEFHKDIHIHFRLPGKAKKTLSEDVASPAGQTENAPPFQIVYHIEPDPANKEKDKGGYEYVLPIT